MSMEGGWALFILDISTYPRCFLSYFQKADRQDLGGIGGVYMFVHTLSFFSGNEAFLRLFTCLPAPGLLGFEEFYFFLTGFIFWGGIYIFIFLFF